MSVTRTRTADSAYVVIYGGNVTSGSLLEYYAPTLADAVAEHDDLLTYYYVAGKPNHLDVRVESLAVLDAMDSDDDSADDVIPAYPTCKRCTGLDADQYSIGNDYKGWYCDGCANTLMFPVWYAPAGKPMQPSKSRAAMRRLAADNGWQRDPLAAQSLADDVYVRDGARVYVSHDSDTGRFIVGQLFDGYAPGSDAIADGRVADVRAWLKAADDVIPDVISDLADAARERDHEDSADDADDSVPTLTELPTDDDALFGPLRAKLNKGVMVQWINHDLINRADCDVRKSVVLYDAERTFVMALGTSVTPSLFRERMPLVADSMARAGIRYWSVGVK